MRVGSRDFANTVVIDYETHETIIDGAVVPYWLDVPGPSVERQGDDPRVPIHVLHLPILVDGVIILRGDGAPHIIDPVLGDVGEWATNYVRTALQAKLPWLTS